MLQNTMEKYLAYLQTITDYSGEKLVAHDYNNVFQRSRSDVSEMLGTPLSHASILILGCGYLILKLSSIQPVARRSSD